MIKEVIIAFSSIFMNSSGISCSTKSAKPKETIKSVSEEVVPPFSRFQKDSRYHILPSKWKKLIDKSN